MAIAAPNTRPLIPAPGGAATVVVNNPLAIAPPCADHEPLVLDMPLSQAAVGKIRLAAGDARAISVRCARDSAGSPRTDPAGALEGMLLPAGHKGTGWRSWNDVFTGVLSGAAFGASVHGLCADVGRPNGCAHAFIAVDAQRVEPAGRFAERVAKLAARVLASTTAPGIDRVFLPGQLEDERHAAHTRDAIDCAGDGLGALSAAASVAGIRMPPREVQR